MSFDNSNCSCELCKPHLYVPTEDAEPSDQKVQLPKPAVLVWTPNGQLAPVSSDQFAFAQ